MKIQRNAHVVASDGELGRVRHVIVDPDTREVTTLVVGNDVREWLIPMSAVQSVDGDRIVLPGTASTYINDAERFDRGSFSAVDDEAVRDQSTHRAIHGGAPLLDADDHSVELGAASAGRFANESTPALAGLGDTSPHQLQLRAERLRVEKQQEQAGAVRLSKRVVEHLEIVQVPLREERLLIECLPGSGRVFVGDRELQEGETMEVTIMRERIVVNKESVVSEEIRVRKETVERTEQVRETLREEQLTVNDPDGLVEERHGATPSAAATMPPRWDTAGYAPNSPRSLNDDLSDQPTERMPRANTGNGSDMYDPTPHPASYASVLSDGETRPVMDGGSQDGRAQ